MNTAYTGTLPMANVTCQDFRFQSTSCQYRSKLYQIQNKKQASQQADVACANKLYLVSKVAGLHARSSLTVPDTVA